MGTGLRNLTTFLDGAVAMGCFVAALLFLRFWRQSSDRLFLFFAGAFAILTANYAVIGISSPLAEWQVSVYAVRVLAFLVLLVGIADKNRR